MKYIDAEKLIAEIKRQKHELKLSIQSQGDYGQSCHIDAYENILSLIDSLQQEQPSLPDNLEEAAEKSSAQYYVDAGYSPFPNVETAAHKSGFIAGAEWAIQQLKGE